MNRRASTPRPFRQFGAAAVEVALGSMLFFTFVFGVIELARAMYMWSAMVEVTRRAARGAAVTDFGDAAQLALVRERAMFANIPGGLPLRGDLSEANLAIDYLNGSLGAVTPMPDSPAQNIINCNIDPEGASCIRFVRASLCASGAGATCVRVNYVPLVGADFFPGGPLRYPTFATITPVATLGHRPGAAGGL